MKKCIVIPVTSGEAERRLAALVEILREEAMAARPRHILRAEWLDRLADSARVEDRAE